MESSSAEVCFSVEPMKVFLPRDRQTDFDGGTEGSLHIIGEIRPTTQRDGTPISIPTSSAQTLDYADNSALALSGGATEFHSHTMPDAPCLPVYDPWHVQPWMFMSQAPVGLPCYPACLPWRQGQGVCDWWCREKEPEVHQARRRTSSDDTMSTSIGDSDTFQVLSSDDDVAENNVSKSALPSATRTSVMMRNIPNDLTRDMLVALLDEQGFAGDYNLVYLPMDFQTHFSLGYAFINFFTKDGAERLYNHFVGFTAWPQESVKVCAMSWSDLDGLQDHVDRYRNSPVQHPSVPDKFKPALFGRNGERIEFPSPTKRIRPPRFKTLAARVAQQAKVAPAQ
jgi:hypothetical protein